MLKVCWELVRAQKGSVRIAWAFVCLHVARYVTRLGWQHALPFRPFFLDLPMVASLLSQLFHTRFTTAMTHYGGCAIDVDNEEHYDAICANFKRWLAHQHALAQELKQQA